MNYLEAQLIGITETSPDTHVMETLYSLLFQVRASNGTNVGSETTVKILNWVWRIGWKSPEVAVPMVLIAGYVYKVNKNDRVGGELFKIAASFRANTVGIIAKEFMDA